MLQHTDCWLSMNPPDDMNILVTANYADGGYSTICVATYPPANNNTVVNNTVVTRGQAWPDEAKAIMKNAGLSQQYPLPPGVLV